VTAPPKEYRRLEAERIGGSSDRIAGRIRAWKGAPDFSERLARVLQHVDTFEPTELDLVATAEAGTASREPAHAL
jgi:hypothetical protein